MGKLKNIGYIIYIATYVIASASCNKADKVSNPQTSKYNQIKVVCKEAVNETKTILDGNKTSWIASTDKVGIYSPEARNTSGGESGVTNTPFTAESSTISSSFTGAMYWGDGVHHFYSYYPYNSEYSGSSSTVPVSLSSSQVQSGDNANHIGEYDFMVANPLEISAGSSGEETVVDFRYNHVFTILEFQIKRSSGSGDISKVALYGNNKLAFGSGTIDLTQSTPTTGNSYSISSLSDSSNTVIVSLQSALTPSNDYSTTPKIFMVISPGVQTGDMIIGIESNGVYKYVTKTAPSGGFLRGKKYIVQLDASLALENSSIAIDNDGNTYSTVSFNFSESYSWIWMRENLRTTKYNDGTSVPLVEDQLSWANLTTAGYCWYNNDIGYKNSRGALYNWYAVNSGKLCPQGWKVPSGDDWVKFRDSLILAGYNYDGSTDINYDRLGKAVTSSSYWTSYATAGTVGNSDYPEKRNTTGFSSIPAGQRSYSGTGDTPYGTFMYLNEQVVYWDTNELNTSTGFGINAHYQFKGGLGRSNWSKKMGLSIRCLKIQ